MSIALEHKVEELLRRVAALEEAVTRLIQEREDLLDKAVSLEEKRRGNRR